MTWKQQAEARDAARRRLRTRRRRAPELVGVAEAAELLGVSRPALLNRRNGRGLTRQTSRLPGAEAVPFPPAVLELRCGPLWLRADVIDYGIAHALLDER